MIIKLNKELNEIKIWKFIFNKYEVNKKTYLKEKKYISDIIKIKDNVIVFIVKKILFVFVKKCDKFKKTNLIL